MSPAPTHQTALAQHRITRLAAQLPVHKAFHWLHLHQPQLRRWQLEFLAIPAPTFAEQSRAAWFAERFRDLGLTNVHIDEAGNALGELASPNLNQPCLLISAHLDTVFAAGIDTTPTEDGSRILGPGSCDNGAGLSALLALIAALRYAAIEPPIPILFAANVGEEGEGDLLGMRQILERGSYRGKIAAALPLEGSGTAAAVTRGLGSRRFRATISGPGGHSWSDATVPNPITLISRAIAEFSALPTLLTHPNATDSGPRTSFSPGQISGGTSINSIPQSASVLLDLRSTDAAELDRHADEIRRIFETIVAQAHTEAVPIKLTLESIGNRPAAALPDDSPLLYTLRAVDRHLGIRTELRLGSTDANLPLAHHIPAAALAAGGIGGGIHTLGEWYDPTGRETALRRILLTLLDTAQVLSISS